MAELPPNYKEVLRELKFQPIRTAVRQSLAVVDEARKGRRNVLPCKFPRLNRNLLGGFQPGKLYVIAGRPGVGKSAFSNQLIFDLLDVSMKDGKNVIVFYWSFEMPGFQQILRSAAKDTKKQLAELYSVDRTLSQTEFELFEKVVTKFTKYPVFFQNYSRDVKFMEEACTKFMHSRPKTQIVNIIDHTRLVLTDEDKELIALNHLSKGCMRIQARMGVINILLSQLNRNIESKDRADKQYQPMLSDLFGGDSIGQDSHVVMMIQRPHDLYGITSTYCGEPPEGLLAVHLEKNRDGMMGMIPFEFSGSTFTIEERKKR